MLPLAVGRIPGSLLTTSALHYFLLWAVTITSKIGSELVARVYVRMYGQGIEKFKFILLVQEDALY